MIKTERVEIFSLKTYFKSRMNVMNVEIAIEKMLVEWMND